MIRIFFLEPVRSVMVRSIVSTQMEQGLNPSTNAIKIVLMNIDCLDRSIVPISGSFIPVSGSGVVVGSSIVGSVVSCGVGLISGVGSGVTYIAITSAPRSVQPVVRQVFTVSRISCLTASLKPSQTRFANIIVGTTLGSKLYADPISKNIWRLIGSL